MLINRFHFKMLDYFFILFTNLGNGLFLISVMVFMFIRKKDRLVFANRNQFPCFRSYCSGFKTSHSQSKTKIIFRISRYPFYKWNYRNRFNQFSLWTYCNYIRAHYSFMYLF